MKRPTIGLLTRGVSNEIGSSFWAGVAAVAEEQNVNLLTFAGGSLHFPHGFEVQGNVIYDLVDPELIDGLILDGGDLGHYVTPAGLQTFCQRYRGLPMVSIEVPLKGIPTILVNFYQGMRRVIDHLIEVHGYRRIAFIRGPQESLTASERYRAYIDALAEHGLPLDLELVTPGTFHPPSGEQAVQLLLDERNLNLEVIAAANDFMAIDAIQALQARHIRVPEEIAVVGFDDVDAARVVQPPLTTARLHNYERARLGTELLLAQLRGEPVAELSTIPAELVVRQSCGCLAPGLIQSAAGVGQLSGETGLTTTAQGRAKILAEMVQAAESVNPALDQTRAEQLLEGFLAETEWQKTGRFLASLEKILRQIEAEGGEVAKWHGPLSVLRRRTLIHPTDPETIIQVEDLWQQARLAISEAAERAQARRRLYQERQFQILSMIGQTVIATFDTAELMEVIARELPRLSIPSCYLSLYQNPAAPAATARLILAYNETGRIALEPEGWPFPSPQLAPAGLLPTHRRYSMLILPLYFRQEQLGFILLEMGSPDTSAYEVLRGQISSALKGALLLQARKQAEEALATAFAAVEQQVEERTVALKAEIGERKQIEETLRASEERYRQAVENSPNPIFSVDNYGMIQTWNRACERLFQYKDDEMVGQSYHRLLWESSVRAGLDNLIALVFQKQSVQDIDISYRCQDGTRRFTVSRLYPVFTAEGLVEQCMFANTDVTARVQAEAALRDNEQRFRAIFEMVGVGVVLSTLHGEILETNPAFEEMVGYTGQTLKNMSVLQLTHPDDVEPELKAIRTVISGQPSLPLQFEKRYMRRDGQVIWGRLTISFVNDKQGQPQYSLAVVENITESKRAEEQLKAYAAELERSNRELQDFAYIASHDLQEPLRKIQTFGDRLQGRYNELLDERGRDYLERMQSATLRMQTLIQDLLTYSRVTTKAEPFNPVDLKVVVRGVLSDLETRLEEVGGQIEVTNLPTIEADRTQMRQLFQNLISNALKFRQPETVPLVKIEGQLLPAQSQNRQLCQITVQDNGIGFDEKYLDRIFGVFQRLHGRGSYEGSGIGLAICRKIIERHGGSLTANSKPEQGSTFIVILPVKQPQGGP